MYTNSAKIETVGRTTTRFLATKKRFAPGNGLRMKTPRGVSKLRGEPRCRSQQTAYPLMLFGIHFLTEHATQSMSLKLAKKLLVQQERQRAVDHKTLSSL